MSKAAEADDVTDESGAEEDKDELMPEDESGSEEDNDVLDESGAEDDSDKEDIDALKMKDTVRVVAITAANWKFSPNAITAKKGEKVQIVVTGVEGMHGFASPGLGINASIAAGQTVTIDLPTDKAGSFDFFCSVPCGSGHKDMKGTIIITE